MVAQLATTATRLSLVFNARNSQAPLLGPQLHVIFIFELLCLYKLALRDPDWVECPIGSLRHRCDGLLQLPSMPAFLVPNEATRLRQQTSTHLVAFFVQGRTGERGVLHRAFLAFLAARPSVVFWEIAVAFIATPRCMQVPKPLELLQLGGRNLTLHGV